MRTFVTLVAATLLVALCVTVASVSEVSSNSQAAKTKRSDEKSKPYGLHSLHEATQTSCVAPPSGLSSWWPGDGNANDIHGVNNGTLQSGATFAPGMVGQAFSFDGVDDYVSIPDADTLDVSSVTLSAWVKLNAWNHYPGIIAKGYWDGGGEAYSLHIRDDLSLWLDINNSGVRVAYNPTDRRLTLGSWHHVAASVSSTTLRVYIDGVEAGSGFPGSFSLSSTAQPVSIGRLPGWGFFNGLIDEVDIFNSALSQAEIQTIYNAGSAGKCKPMDRVYVTNSDANTVVAIDAATLGTVATIPVGSEPVGAALSPDGRLLYVMNGNSSSVSVVSTAADTVIATIPVTGFPIAAAFSVDDSRAYVTDGLGVAVINVATNSVSTHITLGTNGNHIAITPDGRHAYVSGGTGKVFVTDLTTNTVTTSIPIPGAGDLRAVTISPDGQRAYVVSVSQSTVSVIDTNSNTVVATVGVGSLPVGMAITADGKRAYVAATYGPVSVIDLGTNTVVATITIANHPLEVAISANGSRAYVTDQVADLAVIDTNSNALIAEVPTGGHPSGVAVTPPHLSTNMTFADDFNRPDGTVGNGWSSWWDGQFDHPNTSIVNGELVTHGFGGSAGGVFRSLPVTFPLQFSFDFRTLNQVDECNSSPLNDGGWWIVFNAASVSSPPPFNAPKQLTFRQYAGSKNLYRTNQTSSGEATDVVPNLPEPIPGQRDYKASPAAHVEGVVNADLSATITVHYNDGQTPDPVTFSFGPAADPAATPPGSIFVLGSANCSSGPHIFDNLVIGPPAPLSFLSLNPTTVAGGQTSTGTVTLQNPALSGATVTLASSDTGVATVPASITIAEGATSGTLTVNTNSVAADSTVNISATYQGATRSASLTVTAPRADLQVPTITAPAQAFTDSSFDLSWTDSNTGQGRANGPWSDKVYLSTDNQLGNDTLLAEFPFSQSLDLSQSATRTQVISIPRSAVPADGQYFLIVLTDANNNVDEGSNENNNWRAVPITLNRTTRPDLIVQSIQAPDTAFFGQTINVRWTVKNIGTGSTDASEWSDRVYLSSDGSTGNAVVQLDVLNVSYLNAGETYVASVDVQIPRGLILTSYIVVSTDISGAVAEDNKANNTLNRPINLQVPPLPDLQVTLVQGPTQAFPGEPMLVNYRVENKGNGDTPPSESSWSDSIYLSPTQVFNPGTARLLGSQPHNGGLTQNAGYTVGNLSLNVPRDIIGDWYVFVWTDSQNNVYEFVNENNNTNFDQTHTVHIQATPPDLIVPGIQSPASANAGRQITINWTVKNQGAFDAAPSWFDTVYLATSATPNPAADTPLTTVFRASILGPGLTYNVSANVTVPNCLNGTFYVYVFTDSRNQIFEFDPNFNAEQNNFSQLQPIQLTAIPPDLQVTSVSNPANTDAGQFIPVSWTVTNLGAGPTIENSWVDSVYLSPSPTFNGGAALLLASFTHSGDLAPNGSYSRTESVNIPTTAQGTYYVFVSTDNSNAVQECSGEGNNRGASLTTLNVSNILPDLQIIGVNAPSNAFEGQTITVQWTGKNIGNGTVPNSAWNDGVYFSTDATLDQTDTRLAFTLVNTPLAAGATYSAQAQVTIPFVSAATYYLIVKADDNNFVLEGQREDNNTGNAALPILIPGVDLQVSAASVRGTALSGETIPVSWTVTNSGTMQTFASQWTDRVILSRDQILDSTDRVIGFAQHNGTLDGGASYNATINATVPAGLSGPYYVFIQTDIHNEVAEANENNNVRPPQTITLQIPAPSDLTVTNVDMPASGTPGEQTTINWTVTNQGSNAAGVTWTDAVYLSSDPVWDSGDTAVGRVGNSSSLAVGQSYTRELQALLPAVDPGQYYVIVRTDVRNQVRESDEANNTTISTGAMTVDVTELQLGVPFNSTLQTGQERYHKVNVPANETLLYSLLSSQSDSSLELFARQGLIASPSTFDFLFSRPGEANQEVVVPNTQAGFYYDLARGAYVPSGTAPITIKAESIPFSIRSVAPTRIGDNGQVTLTLNGARFQDGAAVQLVANGVTLPAAQVIVLDSATAKARFLFTNAPHGLYDVVLMSPDSATATASQSVTIETATTLQSTVNVTGNLNPRVGRQMTAFAAVKNTSNVDIPNLTVVGSYEGNVALRFNLPNGTLPASQTANGISSKANRPNGTLQTAQDSDGAPPSYFVDGQTISFFNVSDLSPSEEVPFTMVVSGFAAGSFATHVVALSDNFNPYANCPNIIPGSDEDRVRRELRQHHITVNSCPCTAIGFCFPGCTTVGNLRPSTITSIEEFQSEFNHDLVITGGTECGHSSRHPSGYKVDLGINSNSSGLTNFITNSPRRVHIGNRAGDGVPQYLDVYSQAVFALESNHWDIDFGGVFGDITRNLIVTVEGVGNVFSVPEGIDCTNTAGGSFACAQRFLQSPKIDTRPITLQAHANPDSGFDFDRWTGDVPDDQVSSPFIMIEMDRDKSVTAMFSNHCPGNGASLTPCPTPSPSPSPTVSPTPSPSPSPTVSPTPSPSPSPTVSPTPSPSPSPTVSPTPSPSPSPTVSPTPPPSPSPTVSPTPPPSPTPPSPPCGFWQIIFGSAFGRSCPSAPRDPNEMIGPAGFGPEAFVPIQQPMSYTIDFENVSTATAAAQQIRVVNQLDPNLDARTLRLKEIGFGSYRIPVPDNRAFYQTRLQLGADLGNLEADISASLDIASGQITWTLTAIDPQTGEQPTSASLGLLPPNDSTGRGQGYVTYTVQPKATATTGAQISNKATITFDVEEPIVTNTVTNTLDADAPSSAVAALPSVSQPTFTLSWFGTDPPDGSGLQSFDIRVSQDDGPYQPFVTGTTDTSAQFAGQPGSTYRFYSIARDNAGNVEAAPSTPDAAIAVPYSTPTSSGSPVTVQLGNITIIFTTVTTPGITTALLIDPNAQGAPPGGNIIIGPADDIETTATYLGSVRVCFNLPSITDPNVFSHLKVLHSESGALVDRTVGQDFASHTVCGSVNSLSPFVIAQGQTPTAAPATISGTITTADGAALAGVTIRLAGQMSATSITDTGGNYHFDNIETNNFYTVTPSLVNYHFNPANRSFSLLANETDAVFTAIPDAVAVANAIDTPEFFVRQHYIDFLNREPDSDGLAFWTHEISSCGGDVQCIEVKRINASAAFYLSIEFQQTGYLVYRIYKASYGNLPGAAVPIRLSEFSPDTQQIGQGVIVNQTGWEQVLENNKQAFTSEFVQRSRFTTAYPTTLTPARFVDALFTNAGVTPSATDRNAAINEFGGAGDTTDTGARARALRDVAENSMLKQQETNRAFVLMQYFGYLRRNPNDAPEPGLNFDGYNFWLGKLNQFNGNFVNAEMVKAFIVSGEYRHRFGP